MTRFTRCLCAMAVRRVDFARVRKARSDMFGSVMVMQDTRVADA